MKKSKARIEIHDLDENTVLEMSEGDVRKITGGATLFIANKSNVPNAAKMPGPPAPFVPTPLPNIQSRRAHITE